MAGILWRSIRAWRKLFTAGFASVTAFSSLVVGSIVIAMILIGGSSIRAGRMTIGDLVAYLSFTALMTMPVIQLASIGTQLTEAFAGLDRIREIRKMATEDDEDAARDTTQLVHELTLSLASARDVLDDGVREPPSARGSPGTSLSP